MNKTFCLRVAEEILVSETYEQDTFVGSRSCGTAGCVAGHAVAIGRASRSRGRWVVPAKMAEETLGEEWTETEVYREAKDRMGLDEGQARALFEGRPLEEHRDRALREERLPGQYEEAWKGRYQEVPTAEETYDAIRHMVETGRVDWERIWEARMAVARDLAVLAAA